jgi:predicted transcriptional regulator
LKSRAVETLSVTRPLDDVGFLARSGNRVAVIETLSARPQTRGELEAETGISKVTVGRALDDFLERGWIRRDGEEYRTTPTGDAVAADFSRLRTTVGTAQRLREAAPFLDGLGFDVRNLEGATVTVPDPTDPMAPFERPVDLLRGAEHVRFLSRMTTPVVLEVLHEEVIEGGQTVEAVLAGGALERLAADPRMVAWARDLLGSDRVEVFRYDGTIGHEVARFDETVALLVTDERSAARAQVETTDEAVREWFDAEFESYRERAESFDPDDLAGAPDAS